MTPGEITRLAILGRLNRHPDHGYAIHKELQRRGLVDGPTGRVYRVLRALEAEGLVRSGWNLDTAPPQRVYGLTSAGEMYIRPARLALARHNDALRSIRRDLQVQA